MKNYNTINDLETMMVSEGYSKFKILESIGFEGSEISNELNPNDSYLGHSNEDGSIILITTDYNDDVTKRYRPIMVCNVDNSGNLNILKRL